MEKLMDFLDGIRCILPPSPDSLTVDTSGNSVGNRGATLGQLRSFFVASGAHPGDSDCRLTAARNPGEPACSRLSGGLIIPLRMLLAKTFVREGLLVLCLMIATAFPVMAQSGVGGIGGTVMDTTGAVLPGATVTLTSAQGTIGGNQETISDGR